MGFDVLTFDLAIQNLMVDQFWSINQLKTYWGKFLNK